jgi:rhodanese-related sulfurtransferase
LDPGKTYVVYCRSGSRSRQACILMYTLGFTNLYNLTGGMKEWTA